MITFVGTQDDFGFALKALVELEYDALEAYEAAINRLDNQEYKNKFIVFQEDHLRHIKEVSELLNKHNIEPPAGPSIGKQWLTKGKMILGNLLGDTAILRAMRSNEIDTNTAYERLRTHEHIWTDSKGVISRSFKDEQKHKKWLASILEAEEGV